MNLFSGEIMKKVIIVGAGLSGLSAGIYLASAGVEAEIIELSHSAGGMCRAWNRKGYRFDGCIQWMAGIKTGDPALALYREVGALAEDTEIYCPRTLALEIDGALLQVPMELAAFRDFLKALSKEDIPAIEALTSDIETAAHARLLPGTAPGVSGMLARLRVGHGFDALWRRTAGKTVGEYAAGFKSARIAKILTRLTPPAYSAYVMLSSLGARMTKNAGYPLGGAAGVVGRMTERFEALGGKLNLGVKATEILIADDVAKGLRTGGEKFPADGIIAACDAYDALINLLGRRYQHQQLRRLLQSGPLFEPLTTVSFGVCKRLDIPYSLTCECPEGIGVASGVKRYGCILRSFDFDPSAAPTGCSSVMAALHAPLDYWKRLRETNPDSYRLQKELLADQLAAKIDTRYPGFRDAVEIVDVATPATYVRLGNAYKGSLEGFAPTPEVLRTPIKKTLAGLRRFCLCSQWTCAGGGIGAAIAGGRDAARLMLKEIR
jgi:phytoene dehydrogenase-like protein